MTRQLAFDLTPYTYIPQVQTHAFLFEEACRRVAQAGWDAVAVAAARPHGHPQEMDDQRLEAMRATLDEHDLAVAHLSTHHVHLGHNPATVVDRDREAALEHLEAAARMAEGVGASGFEFSPGWTLGGVDDNREWERAVQSTEELLARVPEDVRPMVIPLNHTVTDLVDEASLAHDLLDTLDGDAGIALDTFHVRTQDLELEEEIVTAAGRLEAIYLSDTGRLPPGEGEIDPAQVLNALDDVGFRGPVIVSTWGDDPDELARRARKNIDGYL